MVDHDQKGIKTIRKQEIGDQITRDLLEGVGTRGRDGKEQRVRQVCIDLVLLERGTSMYITVNKRCKTQPPKFRSNKLASFENSWVTSSRMVMMVGDNELLKVCITGNIDMALIS